MASTVISTTTLLAGEAATVRVEPQPSGDTLLTVTLDQPDPEPMLLGLSGMPGTEWQSYLSFYGKDRIAVTRGFGKDNLYGADADSLTEWDKWGSGKWVGADPRTHMVLSVKDDSDEYLDQWAATFPAPADLAALGFGGVTAIYWHEPEDDVRAGSFSWANFRSQLSSVVAWRERHPRGKELIRWVGPCLTKWDLVDLGNDPRNAGVDGMNIFCFDAYQSKPSDGRYMTGQELVDRPADIIHAAYPGIPLGIPEYGLARQTVDTTGSGWVNAHRALVSHMRARGDIRFACAFNSAGSMPEVPFYTSGPVAALYRDELLAPMP